LVFEYCDLLFKALREQWGCFKEQYKVMLLPGKDRVGAGVDADSEADKAEEESARSYNGPRSRRSGRRSFTRWRSAGRQDHWCLHYLGRSASLR
jgi:hypothetical protein